MGKTKKPKTEANPDQQPICSTHTINMLDNNLLAKVFSYLPVEEILNMEEVCQAWRRASQVVWSGVKKLDYCKWQIEKKFPESSSSTIFIIIKKLLSRCGCYLEDLRLDSITDSLILPFIRDNCPNLTHLSLTLTKWTASHVPKLFDNMSKLRSFTITTDDNRDVLLNLGQAMSAVTGTLEDFSFYGADKLFGIGNLLTYVSTPESWIETFKAFKALHTLAINGFSIPAEVMSALSQVQTLKNIRMMDMAVQYRSTLYVLANLKNLEDVHLDFDEVDDILLVKLSQNCKNLRSLDVLDHWITDVGLTSLAKLEKLEALSFDRMESDDNWLKITDDSIGQFKNMKTFDCSGCKKVTDKAIKILLDNSPCLEYLSVTNTSITRKTVQHAAKITKKRTNNISLSLNVELKGFTYEIYRKPMYSSPFLNVTNWHPCGGWH